MSWQHDHYTSEQLVAWVRRQLADEDAAALELHLAACDDCAFRARAEYDLSAESGRSSLSAHATALAREGVLSVAGRMPAAAREQLAAWVRSGMDRLHGLLRVTAGEVLDLPGIGAGVSREPVPVFRGSPARRRLAVIRVRTGETQDPLIAEIYLIEGSLHVRFPALRSGEQPPRPFLLPLDDSVPAAEIQAQWSEQMNMWVATFQEPPLDYLVIIAPPASLPDTDKNAVG